MHKRFVFLLCIAMTPLLAGDGEDAIARSEECLDCHEEVQDVLKLTVHNHPMQVACTSCHGYTQDHIDDPDLGNINSGRGVDGMNMCLTCHENEIHAATPRKNAHAAADITCEQCHAVHPEDGPTGVFPLLASEQKDLCTDCHLDVKVAMAKPYTHKLDVGVMECSSCHDPHGGRGRKSFHAGSMEGTCNSCHTDVRGPFVFPHVSGIDGDCMSCHEPHGSSNPRQLTRTNVAQLCLECHSTFPSSTFGSQPPSTHDLRSPRYRNCLTCHTAVHGSSRSPVLVK